MKDTNMGQVLSSNSWKDQFIEAITISASGDDDDDNAANDDAGTIKHFIYFPLFFYYIISTPFTKRTTL